MNYCVYCRNPFEPDVRADTAKEVAICLECGEITVRRQAGDSDKTLERCFSCLKEVTLAGYFCLWCGAGIRDAFTAAVNEAVLQPSPFRPRWQISSWVGEGAGSEASLCPRCSQRIRRDDSPLSNKGGTIYAICRSCLERKMR
jgi:hypothetical protein